MLANASSGDLAALQICKKWTWEDYVTFYAKMDNKTCIQLLEVSKKLSISIPILMRLIIGGNRHTREGVFKLTGELKVQDGFWDDLEKTGNYVKCILEIIRKNEKFANLEKSSTFVEALYTFLANICPKPKYFIGKFENKIHFINKGMSRKYYKQAFIDIYNHNLQSGRLSDIL